MLFSVFSVCRTVTLYILANVTFSGLLSRSIWYMSREDWVCVVLIILGFLLFLVGANYYDSLVGWLGVFLFVGGIVALVVMYVYGVLSKHPSQAGAPQNP
jgi:hypothetical protein